MKKTISLVLVFSILALSIPLTAKERKGADLIIQKTDGTPVRGELIAVKENSLLLLERDSGVDVTVDIDNVKVITIVGKSKAVEGGLLGLLIGGGLSVTALVTSSVLRLEIPRLGYAFWGGIGASIGVFIGSGINRTIRLEGKSDSEIQEILEKLRKKARVRNSQ